MEADAEILQPFELRYSDLVLLSSTACSHSTPVSNFYSSASSAPAPAPAPAPEKVRRLEALSGKVMEALGTLGPGLLCITEVPKGSSLRRALLPVARKLALLGKSDRARILKEHGLGTDVPLKDLDRTVSSFAMQLRYEKDRGRDAANGSHDKGFNNMQVLINSSDNNFEGLGSTFKELGLCMMELGHRIAQVCDRAIGGRELEDSIVGSCSAKGRLIHYHSYLDNHILKDMTKKGKVRKGRMSQHSASQTFPSAKFADTEKPKTEMLFQDAGASLLEAASEKPNTKTAPKTCRVSVSNLWQQWHYDYGTFTILTAPLFLSSDEGTKEVDSHCYQSSSLECDSPDGHSYLQLLDINKDKILLVKSPPDSFIVQIGESADILSRGNLRSTLHSVCRPHGGLENISREMFVVFLQPSWEKILKSPEWLSAGEREVESSVDETASVDGSDMELKSGAEVGGFHKLKHEILKSIPPLSCRLKDGMTFAEFSRETTRQYYGGSGTQPRNKTTDL